jgi:peptidoglycan hydrolase-like protein with peptidoglycan-binding domain
MKTRGTSSSHESQKTTSTSVLSHVEAPEGKPTARRRRSPAVILTLGIVIVGALVAGGSWVTHLPRHGAGRPEQIHLNTATVTQGDVVQESTQRGILAFSGSQPVVSRIAGTVTWLPEEGSTIAPGTALFAVDTRPVFLLRGAVPVWRTFTAGMGEGDDVRQLEENLHAFGLFRGDPDRTFTARTADSIRAWQKNSGLDQTGTLEASSILFSPTDIRVGTVAARLGAQVADGTEIFAGTSTEKIVTVDLKLENQQLATVGGEVTVVLPSNVEMTGTVSRVGQPTDKPAATDAATTVVVPVTITLADQAAAAAFVQIGVTVRFPSTVEKDALTVPVEALIATGPNDFAVQFPPDTGDNGPKTMPVTLGAFQAGRVQISGNGIAAGVEVVIP